MDKWWHLLLIPALKRQRQVDLCEFEVSMVYIMGSRTVKATKRNGLENKKQIKKNYKNKGMFNQFKLLKYL